MKKALIIVESPAKIKTLKKFLGSNYLFESSLGHIRDLPKKGFGIDLENDFEPQYRFLMKSKKRSHGLRKPPSKPKSFTSPLTLTAKERPSPGTFSPSFPKALSRSASPSMRSRKKLSLKP